MEDNRKGICTNIGNCKNADSKLPIEVSLTADFICPECERELMEIKGKRPFPLKKVLLISTPILIIGILIWGGIALFSGKSEQQEKNKSDLLSKISNIDKTEPPANNENKTATTENNTEENKPTPETPKKTAEKKSDPNNLTANSLEEYLQKLGDNSIPYSKKDNLKKEIITKYFADDNALIVEIGANNTEVSHPAVKDYVEELSQQYYKIKILKKETNGNQKITKLFIKEQ